ncbi:MAG: alanine--tRNA ligase [Clostridia bacterium]
MNERSLNVLREKFLSFFEGKGHLVVPSFPLVPKDDPSILLVNAGMAPLKPYFTGAKKPPSPRMANCQKCIRTPDIERVGKTSRHGTFFEMLGNFSFGDYFKEDAIRWAWEFLTMEMKIPEERLLVSVYLEDDEAYAIWNEQMGLGPEKIFRLGKEDNFWELGTGPCGPCSEIHYDRGADKGCQEPGCGVGCDCDRYIEVWNLVFTQFDKLEDGSYVPLEKKNIDTGMGLERLACVVQGVDNLFEVDTIRAILDKVCDIAGKDYKKNENDDVSIRIVTDHIRSTVMMISDGILPSNEGRGYVLRRLLRRAARHGKLLGVERPFLTELADVAIAESRKAYPELVEKAEYIRKVLSTEEDRFRSTIEQGLVILREAIEEMRVGDAVEIPGESAFKLYDTYGFPYELTEEIALENGLTVDRQGYDREMDKQRQMARNAKKTGQSDGWDTSKGMFNGIKPTVFTGYDEEQGHATVLGIREDDGQTTLVLDRTPFYAEGGGQVWDTGTISNENFHMKVERCIQDDNGLYLHQGHVEKGTVLPGEPVKAGIDVERRSHIRRNHTVTHLLHHVLRNTLGNHVRQAGSYVDDERLRFDFTHFAPLTEEETALIQDTVNGIILEALPVTTRLMTLEEAQKSNVTALFEEKYGNQVRVVSVGEASRELCGGTHLGNTGQAGIFKVLSENGISAGVRRIEALTGWNAYRHYEDTDRMLRGLARELKATDIGLVPSRVLNLAKELKESRRENDALRGNALKDAMEGFLEKAETMGTSKVIVEKVEGMDMEQLRSSLDRVREKHEDCVAILAGFSGDTVNFAGVASKPAVQKGIHMGNLLKEAARMTGGGGGGRPDMAQAGGKDASKTDEALAFVKSRIREVLGR